jgi:hypothetical protein
LLVSMTCGRCGADDTKIVWAAGAGALAPPVSAPPPRLKTADGAARTPAAALLAAVLLTAGQPQPAAAATAVWAGGCFWCMEQAFEAVPGVETAVSGYTGGTMEDPTYHDHGTHVEAILVSVRPPPRRGAPELGFQRRVHSWRRLGFVGWFGTLCGVSGRAATCRAGAR